MHRRVRLALLLVLLALALLGMTSSRSGIFSSTAQGSHPLRTCFGDLPALATAGLGEIVQLRAALLPVMAPLAHGRYYQVGIAAPQDAFSDDSPLAVRSSRLPEGGWPASFEMRAWALAGGDVAGDVFVFATEAQARAFFEKATSTRCRHAGTEMAVSTPYGARDLAWINPDDVAQLDVYLVRGARVYRIGEVPSWAGDSRFSEVELERLAARVNAMACRLAQAGCGTISPR